MSGREELTAESEALLRHLAAQGYVMLAPVMDDLRAIEAAAVTRDHARCDALRAAVPERPWTLFTSIAAWVCYACKAERYQRGLTPDDDRDGHHRGCAWVAALAPTVAASDACATCGHRIVEHDYPDENIACCGDGCHCAGYLAPSPATEAER